MYCHTPWTGPERWGCFHSAWLERCLSSLSSGLWRHSSHAHTHTEHTQLDITKGNGNETNLNPSLCKDPHPNPKSVSMQNGRDFSVIVQRPGRPCREHDGSSSCHSLLRLRLLHTPFFRPAVQASKHSILGCCVSVVLCVALCVHMGSSYIAEASLSFGAQ